MVQARSFAELLEQALLRYQNRAVEIAQVIEELIALAREMRAAEARGEELGLSDDELAFYDALETNDSAVAVLGDETLEAIARELKGGDTIPFRTPGRPPRNGSCPRGARERPRPATGLLERILRKYGDPPDKEERATRTVLEQAEVLSDGWCSSTSHSPTS